MDSNYRKVKKRKMKTYVSLIERSVQIKNNISKHIIPLMFVCIIGFFVIMAVNYRISSNKASMVITFNYENAAKGLTPNGIKFNMFEIASSDIMKTALEYAGVTTVTPEELSDCVTVAMDSTEKFSETDESTYYIATTFNIDYRQPQEITKKNISAESMLGLMGKAYKDYFFSRYAEKGDALNIDIALDDDREYMENYEYFLLQATQVRDYLNRRSNENSTFTSPTTGETFLSAKKKVDNYISVSLNKCKAYILECGLAKNRKNYISKLNHLNSLIEVKHSKRTAAYEIRNNVVKEYDGSMISTVLVPTEDLDSKYYMSKTQTGIDYLAVDASNDGSAASAFQKIILQNNSILSHMKKVSYNSPKQIKKINNMMYSLRDDLKKIVDTAQKTDSDYILSEANNYLIQNVHKKSFCEKINIKSTIFFTLIFWIVVIWICCRYENRKKDRSEDISSI